jgi:glutamine amidotransferase
MRVTIFDYGAGNLHSIARAVSPDGAVVTVERDPARCTVADLLVLPGVGAFAPAAARLAPARERLRDAAAAGLPVIGVCLGMQLLFDASDEGDGAGLGVLRGRVERLCARRVPQIGWNTLDNAGESLLRDHPLERGYYANGYVCRPSDESCVSAWSTHEGDRFPAIVRGAARVIGFQFHPEKSGRAGLRILRAAIAELTRCA